MPFTSFMRSPDFRSRIVSGPGSLLTQCSVWQMNPQCYHVGIRNESSYVIQKYWKMSVGSMICYNYFKRFWLIVKYKKNCQIPQYFCFNSSNKTIIHNENLVPRLTIYRFYVDNFKIKMFSWSRLLTQISSSMRWSPLTCAI